MMNTITAKKNLDLFFGLTTTSFTKIAVCQCVIGRPGAPMPQPGRFKALDPLYPNHFQNLTPRCNSLNMSLNCLVSEESTKGLLGNFMFSNSFNNVQNVFKITIFFRRTTKIAKRLEASRAFSCSSQSQLRHFLNQKIFTFSSYLHKRRQGGAMAPLDFHT